MSTKAVMVPPLAQNVFDHISTAADAHDMLVRRIDYHPRSGADISFVVDDGPPDTGRTADGLISWHRTGRFVNCYLSDEFFRGFAQGQLLGEQRQPFAGLRAIVEHTSMTPIYPVNIATYRSTLIGDLMARCFSYLGAKVTPHFWLQDNAGQLALLPVDMPAHIFDNRKADHCAGALFSYALSVRRASGVQLDDIDAAYPLARRVVEDFLASGPNSDRLSRHALVRRIQDCFSQTLEGCGCLPVVFDLHSEITAVEELRDLRRRALEVAVDHPEFEVRPLASNKNYYAENVVYYSYLFDQADTVMSIIPSNQEVSVRRAAELACELSGVDPSMLVIAPYGDVFIDGHRDTPSRPLFHSVDELIASGGVRALGRLNRALLRHRAASRVDLGWKVLASASPIADRLARRGLQGVKLLRALCLMYDESWTVANLVIRSLEVTHLENWTRRVLSVLPGPGASVDADCRRVAGRLELAVNSLTNPMQRLMVND